MLIHFTSACFWLHHYVFQPSFFKRQRGRFRLQNLTARTISGVSEQLYIIMVHVFAQTIQSGDGVADIQCIHRCCLVKWVESQ